MASQEEDKKKKRKREDVQEEHPVEPTKKVKAQKKDKNPVANWKLLKKSLPVSDKPKTELTKKPSFKAAPPKEPVEKRETTPSGPKKKVMAPLPIWNEEDTTTTDILALDCEMVGVGIKGKESVLARVCIVNMHGAVIYDQHVQSIERITDFRTKFSGIRPKDLNPFKAKPFKEVQQEVADIIKDRTVVGHSLENDFKALMLSHPYKLRRDTAMYRPFKRTKTKPHALRHLVKAIFGVEIQKGEHNPFEDARSALMLYLHVKKEWESDIKKFLKKKIRKR